MDTLEMILFILIRFTELCLNKKLTIAMTLSAIDNC